MKPMFLRGLLRRPVLGPVIFVLGIVGGAIAMLTVVHSILHMEAVTPTSDVSAYSPISEHIVEQEPLESDERPNFSAMGMGDDSYAMYLRSRFPKDLGYSSWKAEQEYWVLNTQTKKSMIGLAVEHGSEREVDGQYLARGVFFAQNRWGKVYPVKEGLVRVIPWGNGDFQIDSAYSSYLFDIESVHVNSDGYIPLPGESRE